MLRRHRHLLVLFVLAGCASPADRTPIHIPGQPAPAAPPSDVVMPVRPPTVSGDISFDAWAAEFYPRARRAGISQAVLEREMAGLTPSAQVGGLDGRQPEFSKPVSAYIKGTVSDSRVAIGQRKRTELAVLPAIEQQYGVPREVVLSIWAMESGFGANLGDFDVIRAMATLAAQGRRRAFAEGELIAALKLIQSGELTRAQLRGSWAGAMGHTQFIPSTYLSTGVDGDGDGRRDIWGSPPDALASAANLLAKAGWVRGQSWAREVKASPGFDFGLTEGPRETPSWWAEKGVTRADGLPWTTVDQTAQAQLIAPSGAGGPVFLLFPNHFAIRKYNNSLAYALAVGLLADRFAGETGVIQPWPDEVPLSLADRMTAQRALAALGFDPGAPDGVIGAGSRTALRNWQKARGLTADGYLSPEMVRRLTAETASK